MTTRPAARPPARPRMTMPRFTPEQKARIHAAVEAIVKRIREALTPLFRAVREAARALAEAARTLAAAHRPRPDRPAWASPYGPAPRTHRTRR